MIHFILQSSDQPLFLNVLVNQGLAFGNRVHGRIHIGKRVFDSLIDGPDHTFHHLWLVSGHRLRNDQPVGV